MPQPIYERAAGQREPPRATLGACDLTNDMGLLYGKIPGDLGADVIKIEPAEGDPARKSGPFHKDTPHPEKSLFCWYANPNKRGITLNLEAPDGRGTPKAPGQDGRLRHRVV